MGSRKPWENMGIHEDQWGFDWPSYVSSPDGDSKVGVSAPEKM